MENNSEDEMCKRILLIVYIHIHTSTYISESPVIWGQHTAMMKVNHNNNYTVSKNMRRKGHRPPSIGPEGVPESHFGNVRLSTRTPLPPILFLLSSFSSVKTLHQNGIDALDCLDILYKFLTIPPKIHFLHFISFFFLFLFFSLNMTVSVL